MQQVATRRRSQPPPARFMFEALIDPYRQPARHWLELLESEIAPEIVRAEEPGLVIWSSIWPDRPDAVIRFDIEAVGNSTMLRWTLFLEDPIPSEAEVVRTRKRLNTLINANLRFNFGQ
ncbi:hypothetical protein HG717_29730 [Rhodococcus erythropolis]|uniref:hypothetical protein n=1 Tax=Rhodococcus TaxID=1827 RepID=UPI001D8DBDDC|nr:MULTISPECIES: hypothetical protein [Rhodococcus]MBY6388070.1 hypothetical protein [Rhodococcus erythropolis]